MSNSNDAKGESRRDVRAEERRANKEIAPAPFARAAVSRRCVATARLRLFLSLTSVLYLVLSFRFMWILATTTVTADADELKSGETWNSPDEPTKRKSNFRMSSKGSDRFEIAVSNSRNSNSNSSHEEEAFNHHHTPHVTDHIRKINGTSTTTTTTTNPKSRNKSSQIPGLRESIRAYYEALPQVVKDRLKKTAIVLTYKGVLTECEKARLKHFIETTPGMDIWISHSHFKLNNQTRDLSLANIQSLPGNVQLVEQSRTPINKFDFSHSGTSKSSFIRFVAGPLAEKYDFAWHVESDVWYTGPWIELFQDEARDETSDLVPISLLDPPGNWSGWKDCKIVGAGSCRRIAPLQMGWMVSRFSKRYAKRILPELEKGVIYGHHEAVSAQFAILNNMTIRAVDPSKLGVNRFGSPVKPHTIRNFGTALFIHPLKCHFYDIGELDINEDLAKYSYRAPLTNQDRDKMILDRTTTGGRKLHVYKILGSHMAKQSIINSWGPKDSETPFVEVPLVGLVEISKMIANGTLFFWNETEIELANLHNFTRVVNDDRNETLSFLSETIAVVMAIKQAYMAGHDTVLIVPNTTSLIPRLFAAEWANQLDILTKKKGPKWNMFQWQSNPEIPLIHKNGIAWQYNPWIPIRHKNGMEIIEPWDCIKHGARGNHPFTISRRGMKAVLSKVQSGENAWKIPLVRGPLFELLTLPSVYVSPESRLFFDPAAIDRWPSILISPEFLG